MNATDENLSANTQYLLEKFRKFEEAHDLTIGQLHTRISFLEKRVSDAEAKHGALVALVYSKGEK